MSRSPRRPGLFQEENRVSGLGILIVLLVTGALTAAGIWWAVRLGRPVSSFDAERTPPRTEEVREVREVGNVLVTLIGVDSTARELRETRRRGLESWSWVDPDSGWIEVPIEAAMAMVAEETRARPGLGSAAGAPAPPTGATSTPSDSATAADSATPASPDSAAPAPADSTGRAP